MSKKYTIGYERKYYSFENQTMELDPLEFNDCGTIESLKRRVLWKFHTINKHQSSTNDIYENVNLPIEFVNEWKTLSGFIENNVMTYKHKSMLLNKKDIYTETLTGEQIKYKSANNNIELFEYTRSFFDDYKKYKCYFINSDRDYYSTITLLFAEEI